MNKKIKTEAVDHLFEAILTLRTPEECYIFFEDVCTVNELLSLSQRYEVAKMLREKRTYLEIADKTGASTATISRVNRSLNYGNDGYDMVFARIAEKQAAESDAQSDEAEETPTEEKHKKSDAVLASLFCFSGFRVRRVFLPEFINEHLDHVLF